MLQGKKRRNSCNQPFQITRDFDGATGTRFNPLKSTCATPTKQMEKEVQQTAEQFGMKIVAFDKQVGHPVTYKGDRDRTHQNKRTDEATRTVASIARPPKDFGFEALKRMQSPGTNLPSSRVDNPKERSRARTLWPTGANVRSKEIVLAVLVKGHRTDPVQVWAYQTLTLKVMLRSNETWIPLWRQAREAMQKRRVRLWTEGLAANVDRVLRRLGWSWENALEVKTEEVTQCPEGYWKQHENGGFDKQQTEKQQ